MLDEEQKTTDEQKKTTDEQKKITDEQKKITGEQKKKPFEGNCYNKMKEKRYEEVEEGDSEEMEKRRVVIDE